jgi:hypothetical protein
MPEFLYGVAFAGKLIRCVFVQFWRFLANRTVNQPTNQFHTGAHPESGYVLIAKSAV